MTPTDLETIETALVNPNITEDAAVSAIEALGELRRRDWSVRVLDAVGRNLANRFGRYHQGVSPCVLQVGGGFTAHWYGCGNLPLGETEDAARHAAALAVWDSLSAEDQARIGECP